MLSKITDSIPLHKKGLIYISFCALLWSSGGLFIKVLTLDAYQISFYRSFIAAITIIVISLIKKINFKFEFDKISVMCSLTYSFILVLFVIATKLTTAANAIFLQFTAPIYLLILEPVFLKTKFEKKNLIALIFCLFGMVLFFFGKLDMTSIKGNLLAIGSGISFALFTLFLKWKKQIHKTENTIVYIIAGNILVCIFCFPLVYDKLMVEFSQAMILLYMGVFQIGISYIIFNEGIKYISATESMIIAMLEAILNPVWVFLGVGEVPTVYSIIGSVIILLTIVWRNLFIKPEEKINIAD
ncbi:MAG TPA: DMT family transporter [Ignavibacteria bacterium]|nr:DMT family transporter [Ignavibacteria bacterium]HRJ99502.1 DMT family transporter [Ignavibacteria bacterium]HRK00090.1 DMT family transporter [Ignavibacteria bacterium]